MDDLRTLFKETRNIIVRSWEVLKKQYIGLLVIAGVVLLITAALFSKDPYILKVIQESLGEKSRGISQIWSNSGKFEYVSLLLPVLLAISGVIFKRKKLKRAAGVILLAGLLAGIAVNVLRPVFGRARPNSEMSNGFYGLSMDHKFHSYPSGHTTTAWATAVSSSLMCPPLTVPVIVWATGVSISRVHLNNHYPSDVFAGAVLGSMVALLIVRGSQMKS